MEEGDNNEPLFYQSRSHDRNQARYRAVGVPNGGKEFGDVGSSAGTLDVHPSKPGQFPRKSHSELPTIPKKHQLGWPSTTALIVNKMVGTGIYNCPSVVLSATRSKWISLIIWIVGCLMTWGGLMIYLEYGIRWPKSGGELYYVDNLFERPDESQLRKRLRRILAYIFSTFFVIINGLQANALQFGQYAILASAPHLTSVNHELQKFLAIVIITFVCQLNSYSRSLYINVANMLALVKILSLAFISVSGLIALGGVRTDASRTKYPTPIGKQNLSFDFNSRTNNPYEYALALLCVMRAFLGYENANFVLEEVRTGPPGKERGIFRNAVICSVTITCIAYLLINIAFFVVLTTEEIIDAPFTLSLFFQKMLGDEKKGMVLSSVVASFSAGGAILGLTFANARVKQEIGRLGLLPFPEFWAETSHWLTPSHALFLHWIFSVVCILLTPLGDAAGFLVTSTMYSYLRAYFAVLLGCGILCSRWLPSLQGSRNDNTHWKPQSSSWGWWLLAPLTVIYVLGNAFVLVVSWFPASLRVALGTAQTRLPYYIIPVTSLALIGFAILWWAWDSYIAEILGYHFWTEEDPNHESDVFGARVTLISYCRDFRAGSFADKTFDFFVGAYARVLKGYESVQSRMESFFGRESSQAQQ